MHLLVWIFPVLRDFFNGKIKNTVAHCIMDYRTSWRRGWDSNPCAIARKLISSLLFNCDGGARFGVVSVSLVPAESRLKSGFFARKALRDGLFWKWVQIGIFPDFGEKCGKIGEKNRKTAIHRRIELPTDENLFLRCYKWMYSPLTGTAFPM